MLNLDHLPYPPIDSLLFEIRISDKEEGVMGKPRVPQLPYVIPQIKRPFFTPFNR